MKKLFLLRHAKSSRDYTELTDFERPLNIRGRTDAPEMGRYMNENNIKPDKILSSPASRAITTARMVADVLKYPLNKIQIKEDMYEAWTENLVEVVKNINPDHVSALMVGHNPGLQLLADHVAGFPYENLPTCGLVGIDLMIDNWADIHEKCGKITFFHYPKKGKNI